MDHSTMSHSDMDHHHDMDHDSMDHSNMDHSNMDHGSMDHGSMDHGSSMTMDHGMKMYFHFGTSETVLFLGWQTSTATEMFFTCVAMIVIAALYEGLKVARDHLLHRATTVHIKEDAAAVPMNGDAAAVQMTDGEAATANGRKHSKSKHSSAAQYRMLSLAHVIQTLLHIIQIAVSYALMLVFMTFNVWLCLAVIIGAGLGFFLFGWRRVVIHDSNEHCH